LVKDLKDSIYATNDGAHIFTQLNDPFVFKPKYSSMAYYLGSFVVLFGLGGPQPHIGGRFGCGVPFKVLVCYVL
jgi:hypothetical protein